jgi:hypothetical protein
MSSFYDIESRCLPTLLHLLVTRISAEQGIGNRQSRIRGATVGIHRTFKDDIRTVD